jgi:hypothetical protein
MNTQQASTMNGLTTDSCSIPTAGVYSITTRTNMVQPSGLVVTITQTGSASKTITSLTTSPQSEDTETTGQFNCQAGDIITVAVTSSASVDQPPSLVKTTVNLRQGL